MTSSIGDTVLAELKEILEDCVERNVKSLGVKYLLLDIARREAYHRKKAEEWKKRIGRKSNE